MQEKYVCIKCRRSLVWANEFESSWFVIKNFLSIILDLPSGVYYYIYTMLFQYEIKMENVTNPIPNTFYFGHSSDLNLDHGDII